MASRTASASGPVTSERSASASCGRGLVRSDGTHGLVDSNICGIVRSDKTPTASPARPRPQRRPRPRPQRRDADGLVRAASSAAMESADTTSSRLLPPTEGGEGASAPEQSPPQAARPSPHLCSAGLPSFSGVSSPDPAPAEVRTAGLAATDANSSAGSVTHTLVGRRVASRQEAIALGCIDY